MTESSRGFAPIVHMDFGESRSCAAHEDGAVTCRGDRRPPAVVHGLSDAVEVAARERQPCARTAHGEVWCWWYDTADAPARVDDRTDAVQIADTRATGALYVVRRDGSLTRHPLVGPATLVAGISDATTIAAGHSLVCVLRAGQSAACIDDLHDGAPAVFDVPDARDLVSLTVGGREVCGATATGGVRCWKAAIEAPEFAVWPVQAPSTTAHVAAGVGFACGVHDGGVTCWGRVPWPSTEPTVVGLSGVDALFAGPRQVCARTLDGATWCWGRDEAGQIGDGRTHRTPGVQTWPGLRALTAARDVSCAITGEGALLCWGTAATWTRPVRVGEVGEGERAVVSEAAICTRADTAIRCRELPHVDAAGALHRDTSWRTLPESAAATDIDLRGSTVCALRLNGQVDCWDLDQASAPVNHAGRVDDAVALALSTEGQEIYVRTAGGTVRCLGTRSTCAPIDALRDVAAIAAGDRHLCALTRDGIVQCVGEGEQGQLGGALRRSTEPVTLPGRYRALDAFRDQTCAITETDRIVMCWGAPLGERSTLPRRIGESMNVTALTVGAWHVCSGSEDGTVECRGENRSGELGNGRAALVPRPRRLPWPSD